eukprot:8324495-Pyramimonas_sp.AAC.1
MLGMLGMLGMLEDGGEVRWGRAVWRETPVVKGLRVQGPCRLLLPGSHSQPQPQPQPQPMP